MNRLWFAERKTSLAGEAAVRWLTTNTVDAWKRNNGTSKEKWKRGDGNLAVKQVVDDVEGMTRTTDEWISAGLDNAIMAEQDDVDPQEAVSWLEKALYCFSKSGEQALAPKARSHNASAELLCKVQEYANGEGLTLELELEAAERLKHLLDEGLILEARRLTLTVLPMLSAYSQEQLQRELVRLFPSEEELDDMA